MFFWLIFCNVYTSIAIYIYSFVHDHSLSLTFISPFLRHYSSYNTISFIKSFCGTRNIFTKKNKKKLPAVNTHWNMNYYYCSSFFLSLSGRIQCYYVYDSICVMLNWQHNARVFPRSRLHRNMWLWRGWLPLSVCICTDSMGKFVNFCDMNEVSTILLSIAYDFLFAFQREARGKVKISLVRCVWRTWR